MEWFALARPLALGSALLVSACGETVPHGGVPVANASHDNAPHERRDRSSPFRETEYLPADLDLVVRLDLARLRAGLGVQPARELERRAFDEARTEAMIRDALESADTAWLGLRVADLAHGDWVWVVQSSHPVKPDSLAWEKTETDVDGAVVFDAISLPRRAETARIINLRDGITLFVSPVEVDSVDRVLHRGPDSNRCQPAARGLISLDWRVKPPSVAMAEKLPSLARYLRRLERVRATVTFRGDEFRLEGRLSCHDSQAASRVLLFINVITEGARKVPRYAPLLDALEVTKSDETVRVRWTLPIRAIAPLLQTEHPAPTSPSGPDPGAAPNPEPKP